MPLWKATKLTNLIGGEKTEWFCFHPSWSIFEFLLCFFSSGLLKEFFRIIFLNFHILPKFPCITDLKFNSMRRFWPYFLKNCFYPFLPSPSGTPIMHILVHLVVSHSSVHFPLLFFLYSSNLMISIPMSSTLLICLPCQVFPWDHLSEFFVLVTVFSTLEFFFGSFLQFLLVNIPRWWDTLSNFSLILWTYLKEQI